MREEIMRKELMRKELMRKAFTFGAVLLLPFAFAPASFSAPRPDAVTILSTGDRLTPGYRVSVTPSGVISSVLVPRGGRRPIRATNKMIAVNRRRFFADLAAASPLNAVPTDSLGTAPRIYVRYRGRLSPNLRAASSAPSQALYQDVKQILQVLRLPIPDQP